MFVDFLNLSCTFGFKACNIYTNAEFGADFDFAETVAIKFLQKSYQRKSEF